jgi:hypothetical protein
LPIIPIARSAGSAIFSDRYYPTKFSSTEEVQMTSSPDITVAVFEVSWRAQLRVTINTWKGKTKIHVREFNPGAVPGTWWPGKGACLDVERLPELVQAIRKAEAEARRMGLIPAEPSP